MGVLEDLRTTLKMGSRGNKYKVFMPIKVGGASGEKVIDTLCKGGAIPAKSMGQIEVWTQGRKLIVAGDATFENTWSLTFWNTQDHKLRTEFDTWMSAIDDMDNHKRSVTDHNGYMSQGAKIQQLDTSTNDPTAEYTFYNLFPTSISAVEMADDQQDTITEFSVDFAYSHWVRTA